MRRNKVNVPKRDFAFVVSDSTEMESPFIVNKDYSFYLYQVVCENHIF